MNRPNWIPLFLMNFLTVLNDNLLKWLVCFISIKWVTTVSESVIIAIASAMLVLPFILLSPLAGLLSVKYEKKNIMLIGKIAELPIMMIAVLGFVFHSIYLVMAGVLLLGVQSSLFSPSKYGLIRDVGGEEGIPFGTGTMEMLTFIGVLLGTFLASEISDHYHLSVIIILLIGVGLLGLLSTILIKAEEPQPNKNYNESVNPVKFMIHSFKMAQQVKGLNYVILGLSFFWLVGALLQMNIKVYCDKLLKLTNVETGIVMVVAALGIGIGCFVTGLLSKNKVKIQFVPIGAVGMVIFFAMTYLMNPGAILLGIFIFFTAFFSGMFKVPLNAWIQSHVKGRMLGDILAYENICEFGFILFSSVIFYLVESRMVFIVLLVLTLFIGILLFFKIPGLKEKCISK